MKSTVFLCLIDRAKGFKIANGSIYLTTNQSSNKQLQQSQQNWRRRVWSCVQGNLESIAYPLNYYASILIEDITF